MFGFSKKRDKVSKMEAAVAKATAVNLLKEFNESLLEEKEARELLSLEREKHEVLETISNINARRDEHMREIRKVWEEARKGGYSPKQLWESKQMFEEDRLKLASEYDAYYGSVVDVELTPWTEE